MDLINECEALFPVDKWVIKNIHVWPLIRNGLFFDNADEYQTLSSLNIYKTITAHRMAQISKILKGLLNFSYAYLADYKRNSMPVRQFDAVFLSDGVKFSWLKNAWYERFCDPIIDVLQRKNISCFLMSCGRKCLVPRYSSSMLIQPQLDLSRIRGMLLSARTNYAQEWIIEFQEMIDFLTDRYDSIILPDIGIVRKNISSIIVLSKVFKRILKKINPSIGLLVCYYSLEGMAFNLACHELGIPSVDIQHGLQGDLHVAYGRLEKVPEKGYELLPSIFWCWSNYEAASIKRWCTKFSSGHEGIVGGNLFLELWRSGNDNVVSYYDKKISKIKRNLSSAIHILYTLEGHEEIDKLELMTQLIKKTGSRYHWWIRLHPCYLDQRQKIRKTLCDNQILDYVELDVATDLPLYALLRNMDIHVTTFSSTVIEAEAFDVPSVILRELGAELFSKQVLSGWAIPAYTADAIIPAIQTQLNKKESLRKSLHENTSRNKYNGINTLVEIIGK
jgi:hypothetical protein